MAEAMATQAAELGHGGEAGVAGEKGNQAQGQEGHQRVLTAASVAGVFEFAQQFD
jgi:hypothetical protein